MSSDAPVPSTGDPMTGLGLDFIAATGAGQGSVHTSHPGAGRDRGRDRWARCTGRRNGRPGQLAAKVVAGEQEAERARREARAGEISATVTSAPGMPPGVAERRAWALRAATEGLTEVIASPDVSGPLANFAWRMPDGSVKVARSAAPPTIVIHPGNAEVMERWFEQQQRDSEDRAADHPLRRGGVCRGGVHDRGRRGDGWRSRSQPPGPGHYPGDLARTVA